MKAMCIAGALATTFVSSNVYALSYDVYASKAAA